MTLLSSLPVLLLHAFTSPHQETEPDPGLSLRRVRAQGMRLVAGRYENIIIVELFTFV